jgi:phage terminase Nu1 subunit (DNA packaging protein)
MATAPAEDPGDGAVPNLNDERARHEREKRLIAELDRRAKEGELVYRADFVTAQNAVAAQIMNRAEALPRQIKQLIPHLTVEEVEKVERLIKEMLEGVANWSYEELSEDE